MVRVTATQFAKNFGRFRDAVQREPVAVTSHERIAGYFISGDEYEAFQLYKARWPKPQAFAAHELPPESLTAIAAARMDPRHDALNDLLDD